MVALLISRWASGPATGMASVSAGSTRCRGVPLPIDGNRCSWNEKTCSNSSPTMKAGTDTKAGGIARSVWLTHAESVDTAQTASPRAITIAIANAVSDNTTVSGRTRASSCETG